MRSVKLRGPNSIRLSKADGPRKIWNICGWAYRVSDDPESLLLTEIRRLAAAIHRNHYAHVAQWKPLDDARGILSQIDNMTAGLSMRIVELETEIAARDASVDTHPKDGDVKQAPLVSGAVGVAETPNLIAPSQPPLSDN